MRVRTLSCVLVAASLGCGGATNPSPTGRDAATLDLDGAVQTGQATFVGRQGHLGSGTVRRVDVGGAPYLVFEADFASTQVPAPAVVLADRDAIGVGIDTAMGDVRVATLGAASGAQSYAIPIGAESKRYVHVYCEPFSVEVARADFGATP